MPATAAELPAQEKVAVIGLGYVGLPLAVALARTRVGGVTGFDVNAQRIAELRRGHDRTGEVSAAALAESAVALSDEAAALADHDLYIVTVPTPVNAVNQPDLGQVMAACRGVGAALAASRPRPRPPVVVFESTVYPGVTEDICGPAIEAASGQRAGREFMLGYSPERINPGDRSRTIDRITKVVAGQTPAVVERLAALYGRITGGAVFRAHDIRTAEAAKVIENAQRDVNIAFINEVTMIFGRLGLSIYDVLDAARTKWNFLDFRPGLVGGHCIGVDPYYLAACAEAVGHSPEIILAGRRINDGMGAYFADRIADACGAGGPAARGRAGGAAPRSLVLGLTFKENLPDLRNSRVVDLVRGLVAHGHRVDVHDALADPGEAATMYGLALLQGPANGAANSGYDCIVGAVPHDAYRGFLAEDFARLVKPGGLVADIKGIWRGLTLPDGLVRWTP